MSWSIVEADADQLADVIEVVQAVLDDRIVAMYEYGSAVHGGLRPASDLDVFVVTDGPVDDEHRLALIAGLSNVSGSHHAGSAGRPVEVTIAQRESLVPWSPSPLREFQFGEWLRPDFDKGFLSPRTVDHDLAPLVATVLTASVPIVGPDARDLLVPVPQSSLTAAMQTGAVHLLDELESDTTNVLLTLCRMLFTASTGEVAPKHTAADWAMRTLRLPAPDQLILARDIYVHGQVDRNAYDMARVSALATDFAEQIARLPHPR